MPFLFIWQYKSAKDILHYPKFLTGIKVFGYFKDKVSYAPTLRSQNKECLLQKARFQTGNS